MDVVVLSSELENCNLAREAIIDLECRVIIGAIIRNNQVLKSDNGAMMFKPAENKFRFIKGLAADLEFRPVPYPIQDLKLVLVPTKHWLTRHLVSRSAPLIKIAR